MSLQAMILGHRSACASAAKQRQAVSHPLFACCQAACSFASPLLLLGVLRKVPVFCRVQVKVKAHLSDLRLLRFT